MADLTVPDVFPPDDPVAQFCVAMAMAANDVEQAIARLSRPTLTVPPTKTGSACGSPTRFA
jgi:hypothetical protein